MTVDYATADNAATAGSDYVAASGRLTFQPGEAEKKITLQVIGDAVEEPNETFTVNFSNAVNATASGGASVLILDDERPTVQFAAPFFVAGALARA